MPQLAEERFFPASLSDDVCLIAPILSRNQMHRPSNGFQVQIGTDLVKIPYRVYYARSDVATAIARGGNCGVIAMCLGTRHHNGFFREECVCKLLHVEEPWIAPYVIQLLGEYVLEIGQVIERSLSIERTDIYVTYVRENQSYVETLKRRAVSYWNEYYRRSFPRWQEFPACKALSNLLDAVKRSNKSFNPDALKRAG
ncbi:MAG: hypothetical protein LBQ20_01140 [Rhodanobacter sp.]|jgi:hypothetical protein|nr:hypothetical protein [Rhodanobacter sp.]